MFFPNVPRSENCMTVPLIKLVSSEMYSTTQKRLRLLPHLTFNVINYVINYFIFYTFNTKFALASLT